MLRNMVIAIATLSATAGLVGCADNFPSLPNLTRMDNLLSPQERQKAIKDLTNEQAEQAPAATLPEGQK